MARSLDSLDRCANAPGLDFVNTVHKRVESEQHDYLRSYEDLVRWAHLEQLLSAGQLQSLTENVRARPRQAARALQLAIDLRELLYRIFSAIARDTEPSRDDVAAFNGWLAVVLGNRRVVNAGADYRWTWEQSEQALDRPLWPVVLSAAELLVSAERDRIKECPAPDGCGWLFLDTSKNGARRWCRMRTCGNVAKARRHYRRKRQAKRAPNGGRA